MPILKMEAPDLGFGFRWDPSNQNLYIVHQSGAVHEQIAEKVTTPEAAHLLAGMWCRGYRSRAREITRVPGNKHLHMLAGAGNMNSDEKLGGAKPNVTEDKLL